MATEQNITFTDSQRLAFAIERKVSWYEKHPNYMPYAICYSDDRGERVTVTGGDAIACLDRALTEVHNQRLVSS